MDQAPAPRLGRGCRHHRRALGATRLQGPTRPYEGRFGLFETHIQHPHAPVDVPAELATLGRVWELAETAIKPYPVCHFIHGCADAAIELHATVKPADIMRVEAFLPRDTMPIVAEPHAAKIRPANEYEAKFSAQFVVATCLLQGSIGLADLLPAALEHHQGYLSVFNGPGQFDAERLFAGWATPLEILSPSMGLKQFPCCGSTHPAIAAMLALREEEGIRAKDVARIEVMPHGRRLRHTDNPDPRTPLQAKFSVQYVVARALLDGAVRLGHFEGEAALDPAVRSLLEKTVAVAHPGMADDSPHQFSAEVRVTLNDGRVVARRVDNLVGRGGPNPMSQDELWEKFSDCGKRALSKHDLLPLFERLETLEKVADIRDVTRLLVPRSLPGQASTGPKFQPQPAPDSVGTGNTLLETSWVP